MKKLNLIKKTGCCCSAIDINEDDIAMDLIRDAIDYEVIMDVRGVGKFAGKAFCLNKHYDYILGKDEHDNPILVPLKKVGCCENR